MNNNANVDVYFTLFVCSNCWNLEDIVFEFICYGYFVRWFGAKWQKHHSRSYHSKREEFNDRHRQLDFNGNNRQQKNNNEQCWENIVCKMLLIHHFVFVTLYLCAIPIIPIHFQILLFFIYVCNLNFAVHTNDFNNKFLFMRSNFICAFFAVDCIV